MNQLDRIPPRMLHLIGATVSIALIAGWWIGFHEPKLAQVKADEQELQQLSELLANRSQLAQQCVAVEKQLQVINTSMRQHANRVDAAPNVSRVLEALSKLASESGVRLVDLQPQAPRVEKASACLPMRCRMSARWESLCQFLDGLQRLPCLLRAESVNISTCQEELPLVVAIDLSLIYAAEGTELAKIMKQLSNDKAQRNGLTPAMPTLDQATRVGNERR